MKQELWQLSASQLVTAYAAGETTPSAVLESVFRRLHQINGKINAVIAHDEGRAYSEAAESTQRWASLSAAGELDGVPITIKDNLHASGFPSTWGSRALEGYWPDQDEAPVKRLRDAGAIVVGKTNVPEFTVSGVTDNLLFGATRNPWNMDTTPGGSSGGGAAAVAVGIGPIAICTDGGGSIRRPAAHNGLYGLKPSRGMVPRRGGFPPILLDFEVVGPIARSVADIELVMKVLAGDNWPSDRQLPPARILHVQRFGGSPVDSDIDRKMTVAARKLRSLGHHIETIDNFQLANAVEMIWPIISQVGVNWLVDRHLPTNSQVGATARQMAKAGQEIGGAAYLSALLEVQKLEVEFQALFDTYDLILTPVIAAKAWSIGLPYPQSIDGTPVGPRGHAVFTAFANALGLPAISIPGGITEDGFHTGFQLCGPIASDCRLLSIAKDYEQSQPPLGWPVFSSQTASSAPIDRST